MKALTTLLTSIRRNDEGQDLLEYALLVALIAIVCVAAVSSAGNVVSATFSSIAGQI
jgi:pilus assembly protein Flp/PilA